jgi:Ser/Thr protein kinase RdoA (MazF antagonist)
MSRELFDVVATRYGLQSVGDHGELEDSYNLNVTLEHGAGRVVVRVYRPTMTVPRLEAVQRVRRFLVDGGLPFATLRRTLDDTGWCEFDGRLIEVEEFVPSDTYMESFEHISLAMPVLAKVHNRLRLAPLDEAAATAPVANHVAAADVVEAVDASIAVLRSDVLSAAESRHVTIAQRLARQLWERAAQDDALPRQLVHGDFWDDNVKFTGSAVSLITDLDFMGNRPRVDDLALTLFFTNERLGRQDTSARRRGQLRTLVDEYDRALRPHLSAAERQALPYAIARTSLCFVADWLRDPQRAGEVLSRRGPAWSWAHAMINDTDWTTAFSLV